MNASHGGKSTWEKGMRIRCQAQALNRIANQLNGSANRPSMIFSTVWESPGFLLGGQPIQAEYAFWTKVASGRPH